MLVCIKLHQLLILLCSSGIPHVPVKTLPAPWPTDFLNGFWWVAPIKSCKAQINYVHQLVLAYCINSSGFSDRLEMHASLQEYDFLQFPGHAQFFRLTFQRALLGWARVQFTFREAKSLPQSILYPAECSENIHCWWWCFPITYNSTLFNYLQHFFSAIFLAVVIRPQRLIHMTEIKMATMPALPVKQVLVINY